MAGEAVDMPLRAPILPPSSRLCALARADAPGVQAREQVRQENALTLRQTELTRPDAFPYSATVQKNEFFLNKHEEEKK
jgi:hypothetical protein